jgi:2-polyprenyl-3-methyl-5-hydroxy-6-metoxy-1,4-benzoquinol methylase
MEKPEHYSNTLLKKEAPLWKKWLNVQAPYKWHIQNLNLGRTLDVGCGLGRNLAHLGNDSVGVDPDTQAVQISRERGFKTFTPQDFAIEFAATKFDSLLCSHVLEHMNPEEGASLLKAYLPHLKKNGKIVLICPQSAGYKSDDDHKYFHTQESLHKILKSLNIKFEKSYSFPFPNFVGSIFKHNESVVIGHIV